MLISQQCEAAEIGPTVRQAGEEEERCILPYAVCNL